MNSFKSSNIFTFHSICLHLAGMVFL